ncbi:MAG TPA: hypothetical protein DDW55_09400 [Gammaproteobacteria bacterium]|nr:hypothetical protein [Gammaproteobacteria bacterium]
MKRRLYFLLPDTVHTRAVVNNLKVFGISTDAMHTLSKPGVDLSGLPVTTGRQRADSGAKLETILWDGNLAIFFIALVALITMAYMGLSWFWLLLSAAVMLVTFVPGIVFTSQVPNVHLSEFRDAMRHGEILLMIDVPIWRVEHVETLVHKHHPEAVVGGVGWHIDALHI